MAVTDPLKRAASLARDVSSAELRLGRAVATGKSEDGTVSVTLTGNGKVKSIELDGKELGLDDEQVATVGEAVAQAIEAALAKQGRKVRRELEKINS